MAHPTSPADAAKIGSAENGGVRHHYHHRAAGAGDRVGGHWMQDMGSHVTEATYQSCKTISKARYQQAQPRQS
jgi:hypothetical protein